MMKDVYNMINAAKPPVVQVICTWDPAAEKGARRFPIKRTCESQTRVANTSPILAEHDEALIKMLHSTIVPPSSMEKRKRHTTLTVTDKKFKTWR